MNVYVKKTRRRVACRYCNKMIEVGEGQIVCTYFMKLKHSAKTWTKVMHFHAKEPSCWLDRAIAEIESRPVVETRGRKADVISDGARVERQKILRRRASVMQRVGLAMKGGKIGKIEHLTELLERLKAEIEPHGGVPKSWH